MPGDRSAMQLDLRHPFFEQLRLFDHHHSIGAAWNDAACRNRCTGARAHRHVGLVTARYDLAVEREHLRTCIACAERVRGTHRKAIDIRSIEGWRIDRGNDIASKNPRLRLCQRHPLGR